MTEQLPATPEERCATPTRRRLLRWLTPVVALPVVAACGTAGGGQGAKAGSQNSPAAARAPVTIDVAWEATSNQMGQFVAGQAKDLFEQRHPGVTLNIVGGGNAQEKVLAQAAAGTPPHVLHLGVNLPAFYVSQNLLLAIDGLVQKDKEIKKADFASNLWETFTIKGKQYALPREAGPTVLYYNKSILAGGGVAVPNDNWTLDGEYRDASIRLTKPGEPGVFGTSAGFWRNWVWSNGGDLLDTANTKYVMDQPPAVDAMQLFQDFRYKLKCATTPQDDQVQAPLQRFMAGGLAFFPGLRSAANFKDFVQPHVGIALHPKGKAGRKFNMPGNGIAVVQPNKVPEVSWEVVKWYVSPEFQKLHYKMGFGGVVARVAVLKSEEYLTSAIPREWNEFFAKGVPDLKIPPKLPNWPEIDSTINKELTAYQNGQETAAAATTRLAPIVNALIKESAGR